MRKGKMEARKPGVKSHTAAEKLHLKRLKKKVGMCGKRRAERRAYLQPKILDCGCVKGKHALIPCATHATTSVDVDATEVRADLHGAEALIRQVEEVIPSEETDGQ